MASENFPEEQYMRLQYGRVHPKTGIFIMRKMSDETQISTPEADFGPSPVGLMANFDYKAGCNYLMIEVFNRETGRQVLSKVISLTELPSNRFVQRRVLVQGRQNTLTGSEFIQAHLNVSFYLSKE